MIPFPVLPVFPVLPFCPSEKWGLQNLTTTGVLPLFPIFSVFETPSPLALGNA